MPDGLRVALISLEPWDDVWRRNQHFAVNLVQSGNVSQLLFLEPPRLGLRTAPSRDVATGIRAISLNLRFPKRAGSLAELGWRLQRGMLRLADVLWVNDPALGVHCLRPGQPALYDVTDDWRTYDFPRRIVRRITNAEDELARRARTVVCSLELQKRWRERYGVDASVVHNGVDVVAWRDARPHDYSGPAPHVGYVGTLQPERLDIDLILRVANDKSVGTVHLIGPDSLGDVHRRRLQAHPKVSLHPPVPAADVPSWTKGLDVVVSPHVVTPFTLSLDAIKSYEYLASGRPIVATATSGFQRLVGHRGVRVASAVNFSEAVREAISTAGAPRSGIPDWSAQAQLFARELVGAVTVASRVSGQ